ncbi:MAG: metallophosphoesterase [Methanotrichaceae archaeon]|nr:metallophosphoesterase [Methanotrichaceae archaeon]
MLIGLISDSHDNFADLKRCLKIFQDRDIELILHAGDMNSSGMCYTFQGIDAKVKLVFGNNDGDRFLLMRDFQAVGGEYLGDFGEIEADGLKIALLHGTYEPIVRALARSGEYDVVVRGHNHTYSVVREKSLLINPGEVWGHFTGSKTAAILDTDSLDVERIDLGREPSIRQILGMSG